MTPGLFDYLPKVLTVIGETGVTFDEAVDIVHAAHLPPPPPESNVVYGVDFLNKTPKGETIGGAL
jgi:hypothetical protein